MVGFDLVSRPRSAACINNAPLSGNRHPRLAEAVCAAYSSGMRASERVTVTMPTDQADALRKLVDAGGAESVSSYVAEAVRDRLARDAALKTLEDRFGRPAPEALAWARRTLGVESR